MFSCGFTVRGGSTANPVKPSTTDGRSLHYLGPFPYTVLVFNISVVFIKILLPCMWKLSVKSIVSIFNLAFFKTGFVVRFIYSCDVITSFSLGVFSFFPWCYFAANKQNGMTPI